MQLLTIDEQLLSHTARAEHPDYLPDVCTLAITHAAPERAVDYLSRVDGQVFGKSFAVFAGDILFV